MTTPSFDPQPCCGDAANATCSAPIQFCQTSSSSGPVAHPGRMYDITLPINPGFSVDSLIQDATTQNAGITWSIFDPDGSQFAAELKTFIEGRMAGTTVTVTNPNAGVAQVCGSALPLQIHIECLRLDQDPPNLVELMYNAGADLIQNPAYNESPPLSPPVAQGNYGFHLLSRQDDPGPFPGNPPANDALCTSVANRGWETNDVGRTFEVWGKDVATAQNTTATPRGTPVQEITSDGPPPGGRSTIWQTFNVATAGTFNIRVVHGARDSGEQHIIALSSGDTNDVQTGDILSDTSTPPSVTSSGGPNPWTTYAQTIPLNAGTYTLSLSTNNPAGGARGGLFTDMRVFIDRPNTRATAVNNDDTCTVSAEETQTTTVCSFWQPQCTAGVISGWTNTESGLTLTNTEFWNQTPAPSCCSQAATAGGTSTGAKSNLIVSDIVCATVGGIMANVVREVLFDADGAQLEVAFISADGARVTPDSWVPGECRTQISDVVLCDQQADGSTVSFLRKYVQVWSAATGGQVLHLRDFTMGSPTSTYTVTGTVVNCAQTVNTAEALVLCDGGNTNHQFLRHYQHTGSEITGTEDTELDGTTPYVPVGPVVACDGPQQFTTTGLCLADGTPIGVINRRTPAGVLVQDGWVNLLTGGFSAGAPPVGTSACGQTLNVQQSDVLCDITSADNVVHGLVLIQYHYAADGTVSSTDVINATSGAPYVPVGTITVCPTDTAAPDNDMQVLCDRQADGTLIPVVRDYHRDAVGAINGFTDYTLAGAPYAATGTIQSCIPRVSDSAILCDSAATPNRFLRTYTYNSNGSVSTFFDTTLAGAPFAPTGAVGPCGTSDSELLSLCDNNGVFVRRLLLDSSGNVVGTADFTIFGTPYVTSGPVTYGCTSPSATAQVYAACGDVPTAQFTEGPNLLENGDFNRSSGVQTDSLAGPGWTTSYTACGPSIFAAPCGASTWAYFTTNAGQVTGNNPAATPYEALGQRSMAVNVGSNLNLPIIEWANVYLENGKTYELSADAGVIFAPYDVALKIGGPTAPGGLFPLSTPPTGNWGKTTVVFTWAQPSGYTSVGLYSNNAAAGGNDHVFDNFSLHTIVAASAGSLSSRVYSGTQRSVIEQVVETTGCHDDRRDALLGTIANTVSLLQNEPARLDSTVQRQTNAGAITIAAGARSVTVTVISGPVTVTSLGQGSTSLPTGVTLTWAVDAAGETLLDTFTFTGVAGSDFVVNSTRQ